VSIDQDCVTPCHTADLGDSCVFPTHTNGRSGCGLGRFCQLSDLVCQTCDEANPLLAHIGVQCPPFIECVNTTCGNFDIVLDHLSRISQAPCRVSWAV